MKLLTCAIPKLFAISSMEKDREKWNQRYRSKDYPGGPSRLVKQHFHLARKGKALDIAAGNCRNAIFLSENGFEVDALDISVVGLTLQCTGNPMINQICVDFDNYNLPVERYDLILNIRYLNRRLFPQIIDALTPGGVLIFETFLKTDPPAHTNKHRPEHLIDENELLRVFNPLTIEFYRESEIAADGESHPKAALIAIKP